MSRFSYRNLTQKNRLLSKSMERLSSGSRINGAADDAAGLAISEKLRAQTNGLNQATRNVQDGISMIQTADGALNETHSNLQRMRELAVQSANGTNNIRDRQKIQKEFNQLTEDVDRTAYNTEFNKKKLLNGSHEKYSLQIGANQGQNIEQNISDMSAKALGIQKDIVDYNVEGILDHSSNDIISVDDIAIDEGLSYDVVKVNSDYVLQDSNGHYVAKFNAHGTKLFLFTEATDDLSTAEVFEYDHSNGFSYTQVIDFPGNIVEGNSSRVKIDEIEWSTNRLYVKASTNVSAEMTNDKELESGNYTVVDYNGDLGLKDTQGNIVGYTNWDQESRMKWTTEFNGEGDTLFKLPTRLSEGEKVYLDFTTFSIDIFSQETASKAIKTIDNAISQVSNQRSELGAYQNRLEHTINNLGTSAKNSQTAESRIRDADMVQEMMRFTKNNILKKASSAMLAQANLTPQYALKLFS
ncbi:MAG: flagellin [Eubacteriales bacterium]